MGLLRGIAPRRHFEAAIDFLSLHAVATANLTTNQANIIGGEYWRHYKLIYE